MSGIFAQINVGREQITSGVPVVSSAVQTLGAPNSYLVTTAGAHSLAQGDTFRFSTATTATYNNPAPADEWIVASVPTTTTFTFTTGTTALATATGTMPVFTYISKYGTATTTTRSFEVLPGETIKAEQERVVSKALRLNNRVPRVDRFVPYAKNVGGDLPLEVTSKGFGYFLEGMLGTIVTAGPTDSAYTHVATPGLSRGVSYTFQKKAPNSSGSEAILTYAGMKVTGWEISNTIDGVLLCKLSLLGQSEVLNVALATATYPSAPELLTFAGGVVNVGGVVTVNSNVVGSGSTVGAASLSYTGGTNVANIKTVTIKGELGLKADRRFVGNTSQKEPIEAGMASITASVTAEFNDLTYYTAFKGATPSSTLLSWIFTWSAPTLIGATTYPKFVVAIPNGRIDGETPTISGADLIEQSFTITALNSASGTGGNPNDAIAMSYVTTDTTP